MGRFPPAWASTAVILGVSASIVLVYFALDRIERLEERQRAIEQTTADLTNRIAQFRSCEHSSLPLTQRRHNSLLNAVGNTERDKIAEERRLSFLLSPTCSTWRYRIGLMRWAIPARDRSSFDEVGVYEKSSDEPGNQSDSLPVFTNRRHSPLCLACISRLTSGKFQPRLDGVREHARVFSIFYEAKISAIQDSAKTGCAICKIILTTLQDAEKFGIQAKASGLHDEDYFGIYFGRAMEALAISLNLYGTMQCVMVFQIEMRNDVGESIPGPYFRVFLDRGTLRVHVISEIGDGC
jgi:hypothetical protein